MLTEQEKKELEALTAKAEDELTEDEKKELEALFKKYGIDQGANEFKSIVPKIYGRHEYVLFKPTHKRRAQE